MYYLPSGSQVSRLALITQGNDDNETIAAAFLLAGDGQFECQSVVGVVANLLRCWP